MTCLLEFTRENNFLGLFARVKIKTYFENFKIFNLSLKKLRSHITPTIFLIFPNAEFRADQKKLTSETRSVFFGYFLGRNSKEVLPYFKSAPTNVSKCKVSCKR